MSDLIDKSKLDELIKNLKELEKIDEMIIKLYNLMDLARRLGILNDKYISLYNLLKETVSLLQNETQEIDASQSYNETHIKSANPDQIIIPKSNKRCEIRVFKEGKEVRLEWWRANRKVDEVVIKDEWKLYRILKAHAKDGKLSFTEFWNMVKGIAGFNMTKASAVFNYIGQCEKFHTEMVKETKRLGAIDMTEWYIVFKPLYEQDDFDWKKYIQEERKLWKDLLG